MEHPNLVHIRAHNPSPLQPHSQPDNSTHMHISDEEVPATLASDGMHRNMPPSDHSPPPNDAQHGQRRRANLRQERLDNLTEAISRVLTPVMICMALAVWLVHSLGDPQKCRKLGNGRKLGEITLEPVDFEASAIISTDSAYSPATAGIFIGIFVALMVVFTFVLVWLYRTGKTKIIMGWLVVAAFLIFAYVGGLYIFDFCRSRCINLDWVTLCLAVWNFTITGLISVFGLAPRLINQGYLILMSALMAYIFRTLPSWAVWTILAALVLWDLFAVLSPYGPLNMLVQAARERGDPLPALVYDTNPNHVGRDESAQAAISLRKRKEKSPAQPQSHTIPVEEAVTDTADTEAEGESSGAANRGGLFRRRRAHEAEDEEETERAESEDATERDDDEGMQVGTLGAHLKLGLGDFVFYSILVAQASQEGAMTTIASFVAILAGLSVTLFLVTVYRKALPALPISICAGLLFNFLTQFTVQPLIEHVMPELLFF